MLYRFPLPFLFFGEGGRGRAVIHFKPRFWKHTPRREIFPNSQVFSPVDITAPAEILYFDTYALYVDVETFPSGVLYIVCAFFIMCIKKNLNTVPFITHTEP